MKYKIFLGPTALFSLSAVALALSYHVEFWPFELLVSFTPVVVTVIFASLVALLIALIVSRRFFSHWKFAVALCGGLLLCLYSVFYSMHVQPQVQIVSKNDNPTIKFATFNKLYKNKDLQTASKYFKQQGIDILAVQEANSGEIETLSKQLGFKHYHVSGVLNIGHSTRVGIISRYPITEAKDIKLGNGPSLVRAVTEMPQYGKVAFYGLHLSGPFTPKSYNIRHADFATIARTLQDEKLPAVLGGDFNTTVFSPDLRQFNSATNNLYQTTTTNRWPQCSWYGFGAPLCLRIDHVYLPKNAKLTNTYIAPNLGSDHRAVIAEFTL